MPADLFLAQVASFLGSPDFAASVGRLIDRENQIDYLRLKEREYMAQKSIQPALRAFILSPCPKCLGRQKNRFLPLPLFGVRCEVFCEPCGYVEIFCG